MLSFIFRIVFLSIAFILCFSGFHVLAQESGGGGAGGDWSTVPMYGSWFCDIWVRLTSWLPATPSDYWIGNIALSAGENLPFLGAGIIYEVFSQVRLVLIFVVSWKVFKALPGRF